MDADKSMSSPSRSDSTWKGMVCRRFPAISKAFHISSPKSKSQQPSASMSPDIEKHETPSVRSVTQDGTETEIPTCDNEGRSRYQRWAQNVKGLEARGIEPVPIEERQPVSASASFHILLTWFSMGMALNNLVVGTLGTVVMQLSFLDAALCALFGNVLGCVAIGYMCTWGPRSGHRTLVRSIHCDLRRRKLTIARSYRGFLWGSTLARCAAF